MIGFYVHHHGLGHLRRAAAITAHLPDGCAVLTSHADATRVLPGHVELIELPPDHLPGGDGPEGGIAADATAGGALHWAPLGGPLAKARTSALVGWLSRPEARLVVCDVSVEVAVQARLCGVRTVVVRSHGDRTDDAHRLQHRLTTAALAPYPPELEPEDTPAGLLRQTFHAGFCTRDAPSVGRPAPQRRGDRRQLLIALGAGGTSFDPRDLPAIASALDGWMVTLAGRDGPSDPSRGFHSVGWVDDLQGRLVEADVVVGHAGANLVAETAMAGTPMVCVAEERPFAEQVRRARRLDQLGAAVSTTGWPAPGEWPELVRRAVDLGGDRLHALGAPGGARRGAGWLAALERSSVIRWSRDQRVVASGG